MEQAELCHCLMATKEQVLEWSRGSLTPDGSFMALSSSPPCLLLIGRGKRSSAQGLMLESYYP